MNIICLLTDGFEETEAIAVIDLLRRAALSVKLVSISDKREVTGSHGIAVVSESLLKNENMDDYGMIFLPGGKGVDHFLESEAVLSIVKEFFNKSKYLAAICAAPSVLEKAGVIKGKRVTAFPGTQPKLKSAIVEDAPVVVDGKIITGRGVGSALDFGLKIVEIICGIDESEHLRKAIVYKV